MSHIFQGSLPGIPPEPRKSRGSSRDVMHAYMTRGVVIDQLSGMPIMKPEYTIPTRIISFSEAMRANKPDYNSYVHCLWSKFGTLSEIDVFEAKSRPEVTRPLACVFTGVPDTIRTYDTRFRRACCTPKCLSRNMQDSTFCLFVGVNPSS